MEAIKKLEALLERPTIFYDDVLDAAPEWTEAFADFMEGQTMFESGGRTVVFERDVRLFINMMKNSSNPKPRVRAKARELLDAMPAERRVEALRKARRAIQEFSIMIPAPLYAELESLAAERGESSAGIAEGAIQDFIAREKWERDMEAARALGASRMRKDQDEIGVPF